MGWDQIEVPDEPGRPVRAVLVDASRTISSWPRCRSTSQRKRRSAKAIDGSHEIAIGDFKRWRNIDDAREALDALNELKRVAKMPPAPVVVRVNADQADHSEEVAGRLLAVADAARQAIRLAGTEFVLEDPKFHSAADVIWTVKWVHDGRNSSRVRDADVEAGAHRTVEAGVPRQLHADRGRSRPRESCR